MTMQPDELKTIVVAALDDLKALDVSVLDVHGKTAITDVMVIASGNSDRHVKALADSVIGKAKGAGVRPLGVEGEKEGEWVLVDLGDVLVHVMLPRIREFYQLEKLWSVDEGPAAAGTPSVRG
jgi:ribosome-associated protein